MQDVIVIGGSYAGMAAALQLARARRKVVVIDAGQRRNRFASHSHGFLGQDGVDPAIIWAEARRQLLAYPAVRWIEGTASTITGRKDDFRVPTEAGDTFAGRRILLATGVSDQLPEIPGLAERWGGTVFHCPYCHGYELDQGRIGVIASSAMSLHQAQLLPEWGEVTFLTNSALSLDPEQRADLQARGVTIEETPISRLTGAADIELRDGRVLPFAGLFTATRTEPASALAEMAGCTLIETPMGRQIMTGDGKETSVPGIFACGDVARAPHSVSLAVGDGAWAGAQLHRSLVWPE
ncbi:NAD(P)/FAD-dependent oxidoreductase (plasmid) [Paracoccus versutus]|uniref:Thioredoxin reductase n=1 Tax=Paracoccus versutus TaxID=34007 RepID=A0AAQ0HIM1_PARVE|nr:NAD(P)/FAD-dependent oxidoreductase [Paracoccus versutus]KGJ11046.1 thioredoxin reductase [Paracoccus versutus]REG45813.1 thioredoxin reductase [Paracoccus versutus]WEJ80668.1 NAD(P)/FAD-dependent oxidoreductase [Paracoccus versutus]SFY45393.1 Thioredoxin reductase [Paracoccus pantotrophus]